jgi:cytochrome c-type biogenesis protein CcmF
LGHAGFGVMVLGIAGMTLASQKVIILAPGQSTIMAGYTWTLTSLHDAPGPNYAARIADVSIAKTGQTPFLTLHPSRRIFVNPAGVTTNDAAIHTNGFQDIYVVFANEQPTGAELRLNRHPLAPEIWIGGLIMALGGALSLSDRRLRIGAPARAKAKKPESVAA